MGGGRGNISGGIKASGLYYTLHHKRTKVQLNYTEPNVNPVALSKVYMPSYRTQPPECEHVNIYIIQYIHNASIFRNAKGRSLLARGQCGNSIE